MEKKTLLQKYDIPIHHLDFAYIEKCENARELEKIVKILRSGEEGHYEALTRTAEEKLKILKPNSNCFLVEGPIPKSYVLEKQELTPIYDWNKDIKTKDSELNELKEEASKLTDDLPPVRPVSKIDIEKSQIETKAEEASKLPYGTPNRKPNPSRIKSTDYSKWDKYDPEEEILRMDLAEERTKEQTQVKGRKIQEISNQEHIQVCEQAAEDQRLQNQLKKLSSLEREQLGEKYRLRGNEYYNAKEYENAIKEYTLSITYDPPHAAKSFNNRALCEIKLQNYLKAIDDCEACLELEPNNIKALLRLAESNYYYNYRQKSHLIYLRVLELDPENLIAKKWLETLRAQLGELAPAHATRLTIEELPPDPPKAKPKAQTAEKAKPEIKQEINKPKAKPMPVKPPVKDYNLAELVKPNNVVKSKMLSAAEALGGRLKGNPMAGQQPKHLQHQQAPKQLPLIMPGMKLSEMQSEPPAEPQRQLLMPQSQNTGKKKLMIQEL